MKILLTIEYFGKNYAGWQRQKNAITIQQVLEQQLSLLLSQPIKLFGSGRTDSGVHACGQKAHFEYSGNFPIKKLPLAINGYLPDDIRVLDAIVVPDNFHAQFDAVKKTYVYKFYVDRMLRPLKKDTHAQIPYSIDDFDFDKMQKACLDIIGEHDFVGFSSTGNKIQHTIRTVYDATLVKNGQEITLTITGNGFLYNMVRIIAGTLAFVGMNKLPTTAIKDVLSTKIRKKGGKTYPPQGLYLQSVTYNLLQNL